MTTVVLVLLAVPACIAMASLYAGYVRRAERRSEELAAERQLAAVAEQDLREREALAQRTALALAGETAQNWRALPVENAATAVLHGFAGRLSGLIERGQRADWHAQVARESVDTLRASADEALDRLPTWLRSGAGRSIVVFAAALLVPFGIVACLLDFQIFAPVQGQLRAAFFAPVSVLYVAVCGVGLSLGLGLHGALADRTFVRTNVLLLSAAALALGVLFLAYLAPNRSAPEHRTASLNAQAEVDLAKAQMASGVAGANQTLTAAQAKLSKANAEAKAAAETDRLFVLIMTIAELPLVEGGLWASAMLPWRTARRRLEAAQDKTLVLADHKAAAQEELRACVAQMCAALYDTLVSYRVPDPEGVIQQAMARVQLPRVAAEMLIRITEGEPSGSHGPKPALDAGTNPAADRAGPPPPGIPDTATPAAEQDRPGIAVPERARPPARPAEVVDLTDALDSLDSPAESPAVCPVEQAVGHVPEPRPADELDYLDNAR
ncbi:MAG: hypothetical protein IPJ14_13825 [Kineosporiaceae bacterium]|nr:hypothetical protein [Kineosporiaceae bacterium]